MFQGAPRRETLKKVPAATLRELFDSHRSADPTEVAVLLRIVDEAVLFLRNQREHQVCTLTQSSQTNISMVAVSGIARSI